MYQLLHTNTTTNVAKTLLYDNIWIRKVCISNMGGMHEIYQLKQSAEVAKPSQNYTI